MGAEEELLECSNVQLAAICLHEALNAQYFEKLPTRASLWETYRTYHEVSKWSQLAVLGLLLLTIFEMPDWCKRGAEHVGLWTWQNVKEVCLAAVAAKGAGPPADELQMSSLPTLPVGVSLTIEYILLTVILVRIFLSAKLHNLFRDVGGAYRNSGGMILDYVMILFGFCDLFWYSFFPTAQYRIAPFVRFGLAISIPWIRNVVVSFMRVTRAILTIGMFLLGTVVVFAWLGAMIFDDMDHLDRYGLPVNRGFENFGNSVYTMFASMTTAVLPDSMVASYADNKAIAFFWMPFLVVGSCIFMQVILATVYADYGDQVTEFMKTGHRNRESGIKQAFDLIKCDIKAEDEDGQTVEVVKFEAFRDLVDALRGIKPQLIQEDLFRVVFEALDDDGGGTLSWNEFKDMYSVFLTTFKVVERDSPVKKRLEGTALGELFKKLMTNGVEEGPDLGCLPPVWMPSKFAGSIFDRLINAVLFLNVLWLILESIYDLNDIPEEDWFSQVDVLFSAIYVGEVIFKLSWWTWAEYWQSVDNRFDFITTMVLAGASFASTFFSGMNSEIVRYVNFLRLVRLLKALNNIREYRKTWEIISRMVSTCGDVLAMNLLMIYLWSAAGVQIFGGELYDSNPALKHKGLDYFESHFQVYNFNDMGAGMITMFFVVLTDWVDQISVACMELHEHYTLPWFITVSFWLSFYVGAPLIAWNVWTAFSIDVFVMIKEMDDEDDNKKSEVEENLETLQAELAAKGVCLHISSSSELEKEKIYAKMFEEEEDDDDDGSEGSSGKGSGSAAVSERGDDP